MRKVTPFLCALLCSTSPAQPLNNVIDTAPLVAPVSAEPIQHQQAKQELSPGEQRIRAGIVLLGVLLDAMSKVQDKDTAEAAVAPVMRLSRELQTWGQGFASLPPLDEETQSVYEKRYLPIINKLNERIQLQADRIAAAEFYGSTNLPAALVKLVNSVQ